ncbi:MAG: acyltransferase family protein [Oscillospiraceae bacterium]|jgi:hypothetical protein|nr:acyltransferase family protein [Oscillospiraceae bacterium]
MIARRKPYIDHLRTLAILFLIPYHTCMIYNNWGEAFYINGEALAFPSAFIYINWVWMMPMLFALAGMSSRYALAYRSAAHYCKDRAKKLLLPLLLGLVFLIPIQAYIGALYHQGTANYLRYFTSITDLSGTDGAFTPGQLWFLVFLAVITMIGLPFMMLHKKHGKGSWGEKLPLLLVILMGILRSFSMWFPAHWIAC